MPLGGGLVQFVTPGWGANGSKFYMASTVVATDVMVMARRGST